MTDPATPALSTWRSLLRATASLGTLHIGSMVLTLAVGVLLARQLGPADYGVYALAMAVTALAGMLTEFGLPLLTMREFASAEAKNSWGEARGLLHWADRVILAISALVLAGFFAVMAAWGWAQESAFLATMVWAIALIPIVALAKLRGLALLSLGHTFGGQFAVLILRPGLFALALAGLWLAGRKFGPDQAMAWQVGAAAIALVAVMVLFTRLRPAALRAATPVKRPRAWLAATIPMGMTEGLRLLQGQMAIFLLGLMATTATVGIFRVAEATAAVGLMATTVLNVVAAPHFSRLHAEGKIAELQRTVSLVTLAILACVALVAAAMPFVARPLLGLVFGAEFTGAATPLIILLGGNVLVCLFGPVATLCTMAGEEKQVTIATAGAVVVQAIAAIILIPRFAASGAALSVVAGTLAWNLHLAVIAYQRIGINATVLGIGPSVWQAGMSRIGNARSREDG